MKFVIVCVLVIGFVALSYGEECRQASDCSHVTCDSGYRLDCHERQCTCTQVGSTCTAVGDCHGNCDRGWHCVDGACRCGFGFGGGAPGGK